MSEYRVPGTQFTIREIIKDPKRRRDMGQNELTMLMCQILLDHAISLEEWEVMTDRYWRRRYPGDPIRIAQEKTNAARALTSDKLTWMRFDEFIQCLGAESYTYTVTLNYANKPPAVHSIKVLNRCKDIPLPDPDDDDEDDLRPMGEIDTTGAESVEHILELDWDDTHYEHTVKMKLVGDDEDE